MEEVIAEKIRAVTGQRRFAVSRDLYDIYHLVSAGVDMEAVRKILPEKFKARGINLQEIDVKKMEHRRIEFGKDWERRLNYLVLNKGFHFEEAWQCLLSLFDDIRDDS